MFLPFGERPIRNPTCPPLNPRGGTYLKGMLRRTFPLLRQEGDRGSYEEVATDSDRFLLFEANN